MSIQWQKFTDLIIRRFQNINPDKEGSTIRVAIDLKNEMRIMIV
jgi:hypothetical protein